MNRTRASSVDAFGTRDQRNRIYPALEASDGSTLSLDFTQMSSLDSRFTFTRSTTATFINSQGYVQFANANLMTYSNPRQTGTAWAATGTVTWGSSTLTDPTGGSAAQSITFGTTGSAIFNTSGTTVVSGITHTFSVWMRSATGTTTVRIGDANVAPVATVTLTTTWQRFSCQYTTSGTNDGGAIYSQTGAPSAEFYVWGAQVQPGSIVGELIQTSGTINTNTPRFDYDPTTLTPRGLLIEGSATNRLGFSQDFTQTSVWTIQTAYTSVSATGGTSPQNTNTGNLFTEPNTNQARSIYQAPVGATAGTYTASVWAKAGSGSARFIRLVISSASGNFGYITVALATGAIQQPATAVGTASNASGSVQAYPNGWYRIRLTVTVAASVNFCFIVPLDSTGAGISPTTDYGRYAYLGNSSTFLLWGAQLESGSGASSYIPTPTSSSFQRAADSCVLSGTDFSSWFNATQGTLLTTWSGTGTTSGRYATINDGSASNQIWNGYSESAIFNGSFQASFGAAVTSNGKVALAYATNDAAWCLNGGAVSTDTSVTLPTGLNQIAIGNSQAGTAAINTSLRSIKYFQSRLPNATLQSLTA